MKYILFLTLAFSIPELIKAQTGSEAPAPAVAVANKIADKLADSLHLTQGNVHRYLPSICSSLMKKEKQGLLLKTGIA